MEEIARVLTAEEALEQVLECKVEVWKEIKAIQEKLKVGDTRMNDIEGILEKHEIQRNANSIAIKEELMSLKKELVDYRKDFDNHDVQEMEKYDHIINALGTLEAEIKNTKVKTDDNANQLSAQRRQSDIDKAVEEALEAEHKPTKDRIKYAINTAIAIVVTATLTGLWELIEFLMQLSKVLNGE